MRLLSAPAFLLLAAYTAAAQPPGGTAAKWEYAELTYRDVLGRPERTDADGKKVEAVPASVAIQWTTGGEDVAIKGWGELAGRLKVELKDGPAGFQRMQVLNALGAAGWDVVDRQPAARVIDFGGTPSARGGTGSSGKGGTGPGGRGGFGDRSGPGDRAAASFTVYQPGTTLMLKRPAR